MLARNESSAKKKKDTMPADSGNLWGSCHCQHVVSGPFFIYFVFYSYFFFFFWHVLTLQAEKMAQSGKTGGCPAVHTQWHAIFGAQRMGLLGGTFPIARGGGYGIREVTGSFRAQAPRCVASKWFKKLAWVNMLAQRATQHADPNPRVCLEPIKDRTKSSGMLQKWNWDSLYVCTLYKPHWSS